MLNLSQRISAILGLTVSLLATLSAAPSWARRYWVAPTGNDANSCASISGDSDPGTYRATPAGAEGCLAGGDTLTIKAGTYTGPKARIRNIPSGTAHAPTIVEGEPADKPGCALASSCGTMLVPSTNNNTFITGRSHFVLRKLRLNAQADVNYYPLRLNLCRNVLIEDVETFNTHSTAGRKVASGLMVWHDSSFITFRRHHTHHNGDTVIQYGHGMYVKGDDVTIEDSWAHDNANAGIQLYNSNSESDHRTDRDVVRRTLSEKNLGPGLVIQGNDHLVVNSIFRNNDASGIVAGYAGLLQLRVYNNLIHSNRGTAGIDFRYGYGGDAEVRNNILFGNSIVRGVGGLPANTSHNACPAAVACGAANKLTFVSLTDLLVSKSDYRLKPGSPAIDKGLARAEAKTDFFGASRPQGMGYDIGPHEFRFGASHAPRVPTMLRIR